MNWTGIANLAGSSLTVGIIAFGGVMASGGHWQHAIHAGWLAALGAAVQHVRSNPFDLMGKKP